MADSRPAAHKTDAAAKLRTALAFGPVWFHAHCNAQDLDELNHEADDTVPAVGSRLDAGESLSARQGRCGQTIAKDIAGQPRIWRQVPYDDRQ